MTVSVIVPAPRLGALGRRCLERLLALPEAPEVIFVPDEREPGLDARVVQVPSGSASTARKRELGLARASGDTIALIDDDAYPHRDWLAHALAALEADDGLAAVCGPTLTPHDDGELERLSGRVYASPLVSGPERWRQRPLAPRDVDDAPSVNLVLRRVDAVAAGLDSPHRFGEDTVLCERLRRRGRRIGYVPGMVVFHSRRPLWRPHVRQSWRWARHRGRYARRVGGNSRRPAYFAPSLLCLGLGLGWLLPGRGRDAWAAAAASYGAACLAAGADRSPGRWLRTSGGIAATHGAYGLGFLLGFAGLPVSEHCEEGISTGTE